MAADAATGIENSEARRRTYLIENSANRFLHTARCPRRCSATFRWLARLKCSSLGQTRPLAYPRVQDSQVSNHFLLPVDGANSATAACRLCVTP